MKNGKHDDWCCLLRRNIVPAHGGVTPLRSALPEFQTWIDLASIETAFQRGKTFLTKRTAITAYHISRLQGIETGGLKPFEKG
ncbi:hypothetical protein [uncultured Duncaniella sp.]|uniref:hypothetical protein n=1 Tax=uncultured Duncaniella sp. TaxID=2768039 RepID=UPI0026774C04|nr:hypothetical protein [uncultured Duncaniella sp.]